MAKMKKHLRPLHFMETTTKKESFFGGEGFSHSFPSEQNETYKFCTYLVPRSTSRHSECREP